MNTEMSGALAREEAYDNQLGELLELLACPTCHASVVIKGRVLDCTGCSSSYEINRDGIPKFESECQPGSMAEQ